MPALFGEAAHRTHALLEAWFRDRPGCRLHYVTARELYNVIKAAEAGRSGNPGALRDFQISPPLNRVPAVVASDAR